jgi:hypothetical protein
MTDTHDHRASDRIRIEMIEADIDVRFSLVDDAREEFPPGNVEFAHAALDDANRVVEDIEERLAKLGAERSALFRPVVDELRKAIREAQAQCA